MSSSEAGPRAAHRKSGTRLRRSGIRRIGAPGIGLMVVGAVLLLLSFTRLDWYQRPKDQGDSVAKIGFAELHHNLNSFPAGGRPAASVAYFSWLAWVLLIALIIVALAANFPSRASDGLRMLGFFLGLVGVAFTFYTLTRYSEATHDLFGTSSSALNKADIGIWCAFGGYLLAGIGAALGPQGEREQS